jgi:hypothetical protein
MAAAGTAFSLLPTPSHLSGIHHSTHNLTSNLFVLLCAFCVESNYRI